VQTQKTSKIKPDRGRREKVTTVNETCIALGGPMPSAPRLDEQIVACIKNGSHAAWGLPIKDRPNRGLTFGPPVKNSIPLAELNNAFPTIPYHRLYYRVHKLAQSGHITIRRVGRSVMLYAPE